MILYHTGSIWDSGAEAIVIPVNTKGVMGAGLAKQAAVKFPSCVDGYRALCMNHLGFPGKAARISREGDRPILIGFTTKDHWSDPSKLEWIKEGMVRLVDGVRLVGIKSCAIPALGAGLGGLNPEEVHKTIEESVIGKDVCEWILCWRKQ